MPIVVTCLLMNDDGKLLILRRSDKVRTYKGLWGGIAGYVEEGKDSYETALKEIKEEVGVEKKDVVLIRRGNPIEFTDFYEGKKYDWVIYSFLFKIEKKGKLDIDWEHSEYRWVFPSDIMGYDTVPHLQDVVSKLLM